LKIVVALTSSSSQLSGIPRHAINLTRCLLSRQEISVVDLMVAPWQLDLVAASFPFRDNRLHVHSAAIRESSFSRNSWYYSELPKHARQLQADVVHLGYPVPIPRSRYHCPVVVSLHDLYPYDIPRNFGFPKVLFNQWVLRMCLAESDAIACVSRSTESRLDSRWPNRFAAKASVIPNIVNNAATETGVDSGRSAFPSSLPHGRPFLLCVAQHRKNKNIVLALQVFLNLLRSGSLANNTILVIVGIPGPETKAILRFIKKSHLTSNVVLVNGLSEEELRWHYRNCLVLLAPSEIEGFGLPVAEAARVGCRIVCSDIEAFRELSIPQCHYFPLGPNAVEPLAAEVLDALEKPTPAPVSLPGLSLASVAEKYLQLYRALLPSGHNPQASIHASETHSKWSQRYV